MLAFAEKCLAGIRWTRADAERFLGGYLTQPKAHVVFRPTPSRGGWIRLDPKTQLLYRGSRFFINGEEFALPPLARRAMRSLADRRRLAASRLASQSALIGEWRRAGYVHREKRDG
jgi:50S ribosomal protein L16 3-hydroxylase